MIENDGLMTKMGSFAPGWSWWLLIDTPRWSRQFLGGIMGYYWDGAIISRHLFVSCPLPSPHPQPGPGQPEFRHDEAEARGLVMRDEFTCMYNECIVSWSRMGIP
jgi:hypothetical protein